MRRRAAAALVAPILATIALGAAGCGDESGSSASASAPDRFDAARAFRDLRAQVRFGPRPAGSEASRRLTRFLGRRLKRAGVSDVRIQRPHRNVVGTVPGTEGDVIVVGAHHDTKGGIPGFEGANDGASGVAVVLELARALPRRVDGPSIAFALFDAEEARGSRSFEEDGLRGSRQYVRFARLARRGTPRLRRIDAMILLDMVGDCDQQIPREALSDRGLYTWIAMASERLTGEREPFEGETGAILDDHVPFRERGIEAVDLIDFTYGPGAPPGSWWHTPEDTLDKVCPESLDAVGESVLAVLPAARKASSDAVAQEAVETAPGAGG